MDAVETEDATMRYANFDIYVYAIFSLLCISSCMHQTDPILDRQIKVALSVADALAEGKFAEAESYFEKELQVTFSAGDLQSYWATIVSGSGGLKEVGSFHAGEAATRKDATLVKLYCTFEYKNHTILMEVSEEGQILNFSIE